MNIDMNNDRWEDSTTETATIANDDNDNYNIANGVSAGEEQLRRVTFAEGIVDNSNANWHKNEKNKNSKIIFKKMKMIGKKNSKYNIAMREDICKLFQFDKKYSDNHNDNDNDNDGKEVEEGSPVEQMTILVSLTRLGLEYNRNTKSIIVKSHVSTESHDTSTSVSNGNQINDVSVDSQSGGNINIRNRMNNTGLGINLTNGNSSVVDEYDTVHIDFDNVGMVKLVSGHDDDMGDANYKYVDSGDGVDLPAKPVIDTANTGGKVGEDNVDLSDDDIDVDVLGLGVQHYTEGE